MGLRKEKKRKEEGEEQSPHLRGGRQRQREPVSVPFATGLAAMKCNLHPLHRARGKACSLAADERGTVPHGSQSAK